MSENATNHDSNDFSQQTDESQNGEKNDSKQVNELPKREENPFSFKHFLKQDPVSSTINNNNNNCTITNATSNINHSRSTSNINGHDLANGNPSPSKSATTSSLSNSTGARPKIPQFQSVGMINSDPKMKRSPKFSSFDSQSSLSDLADEKSNLHSSRSNNSFNLDYSPSISSLNHNHESVERSYDMDPLPRVDRKFTNSNFNHRLSNNSTSNNTNLLPDFVQDHLLMEWVNFADSPTKKNSPLSGDFERSSDFNLENDVHDLTRGADDLVRNLSNVRSYPDADDLPFDRFNLSNFNQPAMLRNLSHSNHRRHNYHPIPLDLPNISSASHSYQRPPSSDPPDITTSNHSSHMRNSDGPHNEPELTRDQAVIDSKMQTLPDFLSDGPIHSSGRIADVASFSSDDNNQSLIIRLQQENERLIQEVDARRSAMIEQARRISELEKQINLAKNMEQQYNVTLAESMEQVEENLNASNKRAAEAQSQANKMKQQVKLLTVEVDNLRRDNEMLRDNSGAIGGTGSRSSISSTAQNRQFSRELRIAATTAENNLRQLLHGVDNLRLMATTLENLDVNNDPANIDYLSDSDDFNTEGPAL